MVIELDFSDASSEILPEGRYLVRIAELDVVPTKDKPENKNLRIKMVVIQPDEHIDRVQFDNISLLKQAGFRLKKFVEAVTKREFPMEAGIQIDENELIGEFVNITTFHEKYNGENKSKVRSYFPDL